MSGPDRLARVLAAHGLPDAPTPVPGPLDDTAWAALLRTARLIMRGEVLIPHAVWDGRAAMRRAA